MKRHYRAILLVLASDTGPIYTFFKKVYESYMDVNPNIKVFFVYAGKVSFTPNDHDLIYPEVKESPIQPHSTTKVINAMEYIDNNYSYDFLIRTNLSTFWDFDSLLKRLDTLPTAFCLSGRLGGLPPPFVTGIGMIISQDIIPEIIKHKELVNISWDKQYIPEDRLISEFFTNYLKVQIVPANNAYFIENLTTPDINDIMLAAITKAKILKRDHFRVKNLVDRISIDTAVMKILLKEFYNKTLSE